jgi:hypothetical protein
MKKRIVAGMVAAALAGTLLPGMAAGAPNVSNYGQCIRLGLQDGGWKQGVYGPLNVDADNATRGPLQGEGWAHLPFDTTRACPRTP